MPQYNATESTETLRNVYVQKCDLLMQVPYDYITPA
jgi:hypothetical protein